MDDFTVEELRSRFQSLLEITKCAVCLETVVGSDVVLCVSEHMICGNCAHELAKCPTCGQPFGTVKLQRALAQVLEALPHPCRYNCGTLLIRDDDDHETYCGLRPSQCKVCNETVPGRDICTHYKENHPDRKIFTENNLPCQYPNFKPDITHQSFFNFYNLFGNIFWELVTNDTDKKVLTRSFQYVPNGKPNSDICMEIKYNSVETVIMSKFRLNPNPEADTQKENTMIIPAFMLPKFTNKEGTLKYTMNISLT